MPILKKFLQGVVGVVGIIIIICSFLVSSQGDDFSPSWESKENINKSTHFTKLTNFIRNIYGSLIVAFLVLVFFLPTKFFNFLV